MILNSPDSLKLALLKAKEKIKRGIENLFEPEKDIEKKLEEFEELLLLSDFGPSFSRKLINKIRERIKFREITDEDIRNLLRDEILKIFKDAEMKFELNRKMAILVVGVNGGGKTTTCAKLAKYFKQKGKEVLMAAIDTFRAAGADQLVLWGERLAIPVLKGKAGSDPGAVTYDAVQLFKSKNYEILILDTAGRIHVKENLMRELQKIRKILVKEGNGFFNESFLVLDANVGQNLLSQAKEFFNYVQITGIVLTKMDGTAKGGGVVLVSEEFKIPIIFLGVGETEYDLLEFSPESYVNSILGNE
ncbi:MAG: signal recognition particle-docking protein FtsY [Acidobacteriota bacterium]